MLIPSRKFNSKAAIAIEYTIMNKINEKAERTLIKAAIEIIKNIKQTIDMVLFIILYIKLTYIIYFPFAIY